MKSLLSFCFSVLLAITVSSCSADKREAKSGSSGAAKLAADSAQAQQTSLPQSDHYYVLNKADKAIFEIDLKSNTISKRFVVEDNIAAIAYDAGKDWIYEAIGSPQPALRIFDPRQSRVVENYAFTQPSTVLMFHPLKRLLFLASEDSTYFRVFSPDSMKVIFEFPLWITNMGVIGPRTISPGPAGKIITANGPRCSITEILTDNKYLMQTVIVKEAKSIDNAVFSFDGKSTYCCDSKQGKIFRIEFGTGDILCKKTGLDNPRLIQFEVNSRTVVVVTGKTQLLMLNQDSFAETGKVDLSEFGDEVLTLEIPPKANYAEATLVYKGVTRWVRFDLKTWQPMRLVELI